MKSYRFSCGYICSGIALLVLIFSCTCVNLYALSSPTWEEVLQNEKDFEQHFMQLQSQGQLSKAFYLQDAKLKSAAHEERAAFLKVWLQQQKDLHAKLDIFIKNQQLFFLEESFASINHLAKTLNRKHIQKNKNLAFADLVKQRDLYLSLLAGYGTAKDYRRINAYVNYFQAYKKFLMAAGHMAKSKKPQQKRLTKELVRLGFTHPGLLKEVFWPKARKNPLQPQTKVVIKEGHILRKLFAKMGVKVDVIGQENIPMQSDKSLPDDKVVNIFTYMHSNPMLDELVKAHMPLKHYMVVWAVGAAPLPRFLKNAASNSSSVIPVGGQMDTMAITLSRLENHFSNNIAIHPQGEVSVFNEVMPVHKNFSFHFLKSLHAHGYKINLVPVTSQYAPVFIKGRIDDMFNFPEGERVVVKIHPCLDSELIEKLLVDDTGMEAINLLLRSLWLEHSLTDSRQLAGQLRSAAVRASMQARFKLFPQASLL